VRRQHRRKVVDISSDLERAGGTDPVESVDIVDLQRALRDLKAEELSLLALETDR